jgi:hypothetical protein
MRWSRAFTGCISRVLIGVMLFAQFAIASYACPGMVLSRQASTDMAMSVATAASSGQTSADGKMTGGCDQVDQHAANLCVEHCRYGQQSRDTAPAPVVHAPVLALLFVVPAAPQPITASPGWLLASDPLLEAAPPPHALLHCVLRT